MDTTSIAEGDRKCLVCQVVGMPRPSVYWLKDGVCISTNPRFRSEYREDGFVLLAIDKVSLKDAGTYSCIAINPMGSAETATFLRVEEKEFLAIDGVSSVHFMQSFTECENKETAITLEPLIGRFDEDILLVLDAEEPLQIENISVESKVVTFANIATNNKDSCKNNRDLDFWDSLLNEIDTESQKHINSNITTKLCQPEAISHLQNTRTKVPNDHNFQTEKLTELQAIKMKKENQDDANLRILAGMYLFDTSSDTDTNEKKYGLPGLELRLRKETGSQEDTYTSYMSVDTEFQNVTDLNAANSIRTVSPTLNAAWRPDPPTEIVCAPDNLSTSFFTENKHADDNYLNPQHAEIYNEFINSNSNVDCETSTHQVSEHMDIDISRCNDDPNVQNQIFHEVEDLQDAFNSEILTAKPFSVNEEIHKIKNVKDINTSNSGNDSFSNEILSTKHNRHNETHLNNDGPGHGLQENDVSIEDLQCVSAPDKALIKEFEDTYDSDINLGGKCFETNAVLQDTDELIRKPDIQFATTASTFLGPHLINRDNVEQGTLVLSATTTDHNDSSVNQSQEFLLAQTDEHYKDLFVEITTWPCEQDQHKMYSRSTEQDKATHNSLLNKRYNDQVIIISDENNQVLEIASLDGKDQHEVDEKANEPITSVSRLSKHNQITGSAILEDKQDDFIIGRPLLEQDLVVTKSKKDDNGTYTAWSDEREDNLVSRLSEEHYHTSVVLQSDEKDHIVYDAASNFHDKDEVVTQPNEQNENTILIHLDELNKNAVITHSLEQIQHIHVTSSDKQDEREFVAKSDDREHAILDTEIYYKETSQAVPVLQTEGNHIGLHSGTKLDTKSGKTSQDTFLQLDERETYIDVAISVKQDTLGTGLDSKESYTHRTSLSSQENDMYASRSETVYASVSGHCHNSFNMIENMHNFEDTNHKKSEVDLKITTSSIEEMNFLRQTIAEQTHEDDPKKMQQQKYEAEKTFDVSDQSCSNDSLSFKEDNIVSEAHTIIKNIQSKPNKPMQSVQWSDCYTCQIEHIVLTDGILSIQNDSHILAKETYFTDSNVNQNRHLAGNDEMQLNDISKDFVMLEDTPIDISNLVNVTDFVRYYINNTQQMSWTRSESLQIDRSQQLPPYVTGRVSVTESKRLPLANATVTYTTFAENNLSPNETRPSDTHSDDQSIELEKKTNHIDVTDEAGDVIVELLHESLVEVHRGSLLELTWLIRGVHISKVHLIKNGERIQQKVGMSVHKAGEIVCLRITSVSDIDEGEYTIQVENGTIESAGKTSVRIVSTETENFSVNEEECNSAPRIKIKFSESSSNNLVKVNAAESFEDKLNHASVDTDDELDVLAANAPCRSALVRTMTLEPKTWGNSDTKSEECRQNNNTPSEPLDTSVKPQVAEDKDISTTMPERRKMKSPSPKMTSTPKMKRKETGSDSTTDDIQKRLRFSESMSPKKEFTSADSVDLKAEYNDGTTRPIFKKRLKSFSANTGEMAQLECTVSGSPLPKVLWLKNNRPLKASDGCKVIVDEGTNILVFPSARDEDVGTYTARAMNVNGSIMCSAEFTLNDGTSLPAMPITDGPMDMDFTTPAYFFQMSSCEVAEGRLARFDCRVVAYPRPEIVWMRDGKVIDTSDRFKLLNFNNEIYSLLIQDVKLGDTGRYTCWARNKFGEAMTEAYLNVISLTDDKDEGDIAPKFLTRFYDQQTTEGTATEFQCLVTGRPAPDVAWLHNDSEIAAGAEIRTRRQDGLLKLEIKKPRLEHSGTFTCQLTNPLGEAACSAKLTVVEDKLRGKMLPKFLRKFDHVTAKEGEEVTFTSVIVGEPTPDVTWLFDHREISESNRRFVIRREGDAYTLTIKHARFDDAGKITCKASNEEGEVYCSANLLVRESVFTRDADELGIKGLDETDSRFGYVPTFTKRLHDVEAKEGSRATFECRVMGIPDPEICWMKDGRVISPGGRFHMSNEGGTCHLVIDDVMSQDAGVYTCIISNNQGKSSSTAALKLTEKEKKERATPETSLKDGISTDRGRLSPDRRQQQKEITPTRSRFLDDVTSKRAYPDIDTPTSSRFLDDVKSKRAYPDDTPTRSRFLDDVTSKRAYPDIEKYEAKSGLRRHESPSDRIESLLDTRPKERYDIQQRSPQSTGSTRQPPLQRQRSFERPKSMYDSPYSDLTYTSPYERKYDSRPTDDKPRYQSLDRASTFDSSRISSITPYESPKTRDSALFSPLDGARNRTPERHRFERTSSFESPRSLKYDSLQSYDGSDLYASPRLIETYRSYGSPSAQITRLDRTLTLDSPRNMTSFLLDSPRTMFSLPKSPYDRLQTYEPLLSESPRNVSHAQIPYETPRLTYDNLRFRFDSPVLSQDDTRRPYEPQRRYSLGRADAPSAIPKLPSDRPTILEQNEDSVKLSWLPARTFALPEDSRHVSYVVESRELPSLDWTRLASAVPGTTYTAYNLRPDREYEFRVRAQNRHGVSEPTWSAAVEKRVDRKSATQIPEVRAPPRLPTQRPVVTDYGEETVRLAWRPVESYQTQRTSPVSYRLEAKELPGKDWMPVSSRLRDTSHYLSDLPSDRDFLIRVRAENDFGISEPTESLWLPRARAFPGVPVSRPEIVDYEDTWAKLSWTRVDIPSFALDEVPLTYMIEMEEPPHDWRTIASDLDDSVYIVDGLRPGRDYRFRVRARGPTGTVSEPSPAVSLYKALASSHAPVDRLQVLEYEPDTRSVHLSWSRVTIPPYSSDEEPLMYMIEYQEPPLPDWKPLVTGIPTTGYRVRHLDMDRDYRFRVRALTPYGLSQPSHELPVTMRQKPAYHALPEAVVISDVESDSLRLSWRRPLDDLSRPISYQIEMRESPFGQWAPIATRVTDTTYRVTGLRPTHDYQFRVIPQADTGYLEPSVTASLTALPVRPRWPIEEPQLREVTPQSAMLSWKPAELPAYQRMRTPIHYSVEMAELPSSKWVPLAIRVPDTSFHVTGLRPDRDYKFRVMAETEPGFSSTSMPTTLYRRPVPRFSTKEPIINELSQSAVSLSWLPAEGGLDVLYEVEMQSPPGIAAWRTLYRDHRTPNVRLSDLRADLDYLVRVRAYAESYQSEPTLPVYIPRRAAPPRLPIEEPYAVSIGADYVKLQWRSADLPSHILDYAPVTYRIESQEAPGSSWAVVARGITHTDFKVTGLSPQKEYSFRVRAENDYGVSDSTRTMVVKRRSIAPILPSEQPLIYDIVPGSVRLSWRPASLPSYVASTSPITYTLYIQEHPFTSWRPLVKGVPHTSYHVTGLNPDREYNFRVQAENEYGSSKPTEHARLLKYEVEKTQERKDLWRPVSVPEISDFDEEFTSMNLRWRPSPVSNFDQRQLPGRYTVEKWEPIRAEWKPIARGIPDTTYRVRDLPKVPDHVFRVRMDTELPDLGEPSLPVSFSRYRGKPHMPIYRPQLYEVTGDSVKLSWQPVHVPEGASRISIRYIVEQREIPEPRWITVASDVIETSYKVRGLNPRSDYEFRVKAIMDGVTSDPSFSVPLFRRAEIPRVKFDSPEVYDMNDTSLSLRWKTVDVPAFTYDEEPLLFIIERQILPSYEWEPVVTNISDRSYIVRDLLPYRDYNFRVRGVHPSGYTAPSPAVPVYRRPIRPSVPVAYPEIWEENQHTARLRWQRAYIPKYYSNKNIPYRVEMQEVDSQSSEWRPVASDVITRDVTIPNMTPGKDYNFRIRAQLENGDLGEPSLPLQYHRSRGLAPRHNLDEYKPVQYEAVFLSNRPYLDHLCKYVPPRMPIEKPDMITMGMDNVELTWKPARVPDVIKNTCNLTYTIEVRCPPSFEWRELASGLKVCFHHVTDLNPRVDYIFRVRAWNEYGCSEPSLPVSLYRPYDANRDELDDEEFEREWEARFGHKVPPKLPMDTPRIVTQSADTLWFTWHPARIPAYATQTQITYTIEIKEPPSNQWKRDVTGLLDCQYIREGLDPNKEYHIRVRAETEFGPSDPTLPIILKGKGSRPSSRVASSERDEIRDSRRELSYMDNIASGVPPRMASTRPISANVGPDRLTLTWSACRLPPYVKSTGATYIIEKREPPGHVWSILAKDVTCTKYEITGLNPEQDYMFRVRARNEYGVSEATLPVTLYRERDDYVPQRRRSRSGSRDSLNAMLAYRLGRRSASFDYGSVARSGSGSDDRSSTERMPEKPEIMTTVDTQYGVQGKKGQIALQVRGYPLPKIRWYKGEEKVENGDTYNVIVSPKGDIILEIKAVNAGTVGQYKCYAENNSGSAVKVVYFELAEQPTVLRTIQDQVVQKDSPVILACKIDGFPAPTVKWLKDWRPLSESAHVKLLNISSEIYQLEIMDALDSDSGLYACVVENCAGKATVTGRLTVEADVVQGFEDVNIRSTPFEEKYHVLEEIGRGRYGVVRRVVEMATGRTYAAHFRSLRNKAQKNFFMTEFEILRTLARTDGVLRIHDAFETDRTLIFVTEVLTSCDLMETLVADGNWTEAKVAETVRKLLYILRDLEYRRILHLDIKPSNIRVCGDQLKLSGFGLSRILIPEDEEVTHNYGSVGYASPEQVTNSALSSRTDVWYIGVLVYIILYGSSPFRGASETEVLQRVSDGVWSVEDADFEGFSKEAVDFIRRLLVKEPAGRMSVEECLNHPWLGTKSETPLKMDKIRKFHNAERLKREAQKTYSSVQLQSFSKILHGTRALYQPAVDIESGEIFFPDSDEYGNYLDEDAWYEWQLQYLDDPDSQIFDIKDRAFTVRESRHAGAPKYTAPKTTSGAPEEVDTGSGVMFREKIQTMSFWPGVDAVLSCTVGWNEAGGEPVITWYRDETLLTDAYRADPSFDPETGVAKLTIISPKDYDTAVYKCVARTKLGRVSCQAKLLLGDYPSNPGRPLVTAVSGSEALLTWSPPATDGNSYLLGYRVDYRKHGEKKWTQGPYVTEEYARISGLSTESKYVFRVSCHNQYGQSPFSMASLEAETLAADAPTVTVFGDLLPFMQFTSFDKNQLTLPAQSRRASLAPEVAVEVTEGSPEERYTVFEKIASGTYGDCKISVNKETKKHYMTKVVPYNKDEHARITHEFEILRHLSHANVIAVADAFVDGASFHVMYENLCGMNIVQYLSLHKSYKEELVAKIVRQVLDALQYLQFFGIVHLNLQPSSIVMATRRCPFVKIQDFRLASRLVAGEGKRVPKQGYPDFVAPEVLKGDPIGLTTDVWTLGAVTFTLLSGLSPYSGKDLEETLSRILFDRYDKRDLYENVTSESIKFVTALMRRVPKNRPVVSRCLDSQWLQFSDSMVTSRSSRVFKTDRLRAFDECYQRLRADPAYRVDTVDIDTLPKPNEEEIAGQVKYMDDALMFC